MMPKAWSSMEEVPYCILGSSIIFWGHKGWKIDDLNPIWVRLLGRSQLSNPSDLPCLSSSIKFQGHRRQIIVKFYQIWAFPNCNSNENWPMLMKCCIKLEWVQKRCHILFMVIRKISRSRGGGGESSNSTRFERFRTVNPSRMDWWLWNDIQSTRTP